MTQRPEAAGRIFGTRAQQRPPLIKAPLHWQYSAPPQPCAPQIEPAENQPGGRDPVRYGDWEYKGLAIDF